MKAFRAYTDSGNRESGLERTKGWHRIQAEDEFRREWLMAQVRGEAYGPMTRDQFAHWRETQATERTLRRRRRGR